MYDVIIVGTRVAGAATAMLLARRGLRVLAVDRATFPSDTMSTHQVQLPGVARLARWGLLDRLVAAGTPATREVRFDTGPHVLTGRFPTHEGVDALYSPRRTLLDSVLVDAARAAGAEVRENVHVQDIVVDDAGRAAGIRIRTEGGAPLTEQARFVVGADGKHSLVARTLGAPTYHDVPARTVACYTYWSDVDLPMGEIYTRPRRAVGAWPTNDGLVMTYVAWPIEELDEFRRDIEANALASLDLAGDLGKRVRAGTRAERFRTTPETPNLFRHPYGPGWALVGDAGLVLDPITGLGIGYAFRDAELLADALADGLGGRRPLAAALDGYVRERDACALPAYRFTTDLAALQPPTVEGQALFAALAARPEQVDRFLGMLTGAVPVAEFFAPANLFRIMGVRGMAKVMWGKARASKQRL
jgi:2-polyprenyl-6-methoxyphenol hydroxylase-like FAD-dependent oxidoreductase